MKKHRPMSTRSSPAVSTRVTGFHISSSEVRASTRAPVSVSARPRRKRTYFSMSPSGAFRPPFETVIPVSKSNRPSSIFPFDTV
jgi:hypothetical protein